MAIAKFGLLAPWVIVLLLIQRPEGLESYQSGTGNQIMLIALLVSVFAYWMTDRIGRVPERKRVFDAT
jgi:tight adherence protein B